MDKQDGRDEEMTLAKLAKDAKGGRGAVGANEELEGLTTEVTRLRQGLRRGMQKTQRDKGEKKNRR